MGLFQDGNIGIGIFPQRKEILVRGARFRVVTGESICAAQAELGQRRVRAVPGYAFVVENFLEFGGRLDSLLHLQISKAPQIWGDAESDQRPVLNHELFLGLTFDAGRLKIVH